MTAIKMFKMFYGLFRAYGNSRCKSATKAARVVFGVKQRIHP